MNPRKWLVWLLTLCVLVGMVPMTALVTGASAGNSETPYVYTEEDNAVLQSDVFAKIDAVEAGFAKSGPRKAAPKTEKDYLALVPQVIEAIECSDTYVDGTLQNEDGFLIWETTVGLPCCYSPRMEAKLSGGYTEETPALSAFEAQKKAQRLLAKASPLGDTYYTTGAAIGDWALLQKCINYADNGTEICLVKSIYGRSIGRCARDSREKNGHAAFG